MYEQHFGLRKHPFTAKASGADVFVGPQTAATMAGLKKALQSQDAVIAVSGSAGAGKSTLVRKALDAVADTHRTVRIGRMSLDGADALEFLLEELGVAELPRGTIRQFAALRQKLGNMEAQGKRLVIVIEDAIRTGVETMAEFEALTAADAGESGGAAIVVMGDERLGAFLQDPQLARLAQRVRQRHTIAPLSPAELRGYLAHCFRKAGKPLEEIFASDAAIVIHDLCGGNPRIANNLVDAALEAAASSGMSPVDSKFIADVGAHQLGLVASGKLAAEPAPQAAPKKAAAPAPEPVAMPKAEAESAPEPVKAPRAEPEIEPEVEPKVEPVAIAKPVPEAVAVAPAQAEPAEAPAAASQPESAEQADPIIVFSDEPMDERLDDEEIPELIQDTLPDLEVLAPEVMERKALEDTPEPEPVLEVDPEPALEPEPFTPSLELEDAMPSLEPEDAMPSLEPASAEAGVPDWERDPTMAELKPDLEALEKAMAFAHGDDEEDEPPVLEPLAAKPKPEPAKPEVEEIPEITLDNAIQQRISSNFVDSPRSGGAGGDAPAAAKSKGVPEVRIPAKNAKKADQELERIAAELAKAKTIEDVDDKLAETLFGEEFNLIAAQVVANGPGDASANDGELSLFDTGAATLAQAAGTPVTAGMSFDEPSEEVSLESGDEGGDGGLDLSASQRLKTVRALNANVNPTPQEQGNGQDFAPRSSATPEPIEDQINTSMTQTLKALNVRPPISNRDLDDDPEHDEEKKGGFFSRFRRS
jgi:type II secretory pathway predicted ATPase ExeA